MRGVLITQCLQNDFVKPLAPYTPLPNLLHVGHDEARRLMGASRSGRYRRGDATEDHRTRGCQHSDQPHPDIRDRGCSGALSRGGEESRSLGVRAPQQ
jgi:hypothetical protein